MSFALNPVLRRRVWSSEANGVGKIRNFQPKVATSQKRCRIGPMLPKLLLLTNRKLHMPFRLMPKLTSLDDLERSIRTLLQKRCVFRNPLQKSERRYSYYQQQKCSPMTLLSGDIRFMWIFAGVPWKEGVKRQWVVANSNFQHFRWLFLRKL